MCAPRTPPHCRSVEDDLIKMFIRATGANMALVGDPAVRPLRPHQPHGLSCQPHLYAAPLHTGATSDTHPIPTHLHQQSPPAHICTCTNPFLDLRPHLPTPRPHPRLLNPPHHHVPPVHQAPHCNPGVEEGQAACRDRVHPLPDAPPLALHVSGMPHSTPHIAHRAKPGAGCTRSQEQHPVANIGSPSCLPCSCSCVRVCVFVHTQARGGVRPPPAPHHLLVQRHGVQQGGWAEVV